MAKKSAQKGGAAAPDSLVTKAAVWQSLIADERHGLLRSAYPLDWHDAEWPFEPQIPATSEAQHDLGRELAKRFAAGELETRLSLWVSLQKAREQNHWAAEADLPGDPPKAEELNRRLRAELCPECQILAIEYRYRLLVELTRQLPPGQLSAIDVLPVAITASKPRELSAIRRRMAKLHDTLPAPQPAKPSGQPATKRKHGAPIKTDPDDTRIQELIRQRKTNAQIAAKLGRTLLEVDKVIRRNRERVRRQNDGTKSAK